jgi:hypothetical protein
MAMERRNRFSVDVRYAMVNQGFELPRPGLEGVDILETGNDSFRFKQRKKQPKAR